MKLTKKLYLYHIKSLLNLLKIKLNENKESSTVSYDMKIQRISTILKKYVLSKINSLQILKVYLWEYRRKVELLHLQSQADLIKEFCQSLMFSKKSFRMFFLKNILLSFICILGKILYFILNSLKLFIIISL